MEANWKPLEEKLGCAHCAGFMFMGRMNGVNLYKHGLSRRYLNLADDGRAYRYLGCGRFEGTPFEEAVAWVAKPLAEIGETLETPYDEEYMARRAAALNAAGWEVLRVQIRPERIAIQ